MKLFFIFQRIIFLKKNRKCLGINTIFQFSNVVIEKLVTSRENVVSRCEKEENMYNFELENIINFKSELKFPLKIRRVFKNHIEMLI